MTTKQPKPEDELINGGNLGGEVAELGGAAIWSVIERQFEEKYRSQIRDAADQARAEQKSRDHAFAMAANSLFAVVIAGIVIGVGYLVTTPWRNGDATDARCQLACQRGEMSGCLEGVHRQGGSFSGDPKVRLYRSLYKVAAGKDLPLLDGETAGVVKQLDGWTVTADSSTNGLQAQKGDAVIKIYSSSSSSK